MKKPVLMGAIIGGHILLIGSVAFNGCATSKTSARSSEASIVDASFRMPPRTRQVSQWGTGGSANNADVDQLRPVALGGSSISGGSGLNSGAAFSTPGSAWSGSAAGGSSAAGYPALGGAAAVRNAGSASSPYVPAVSKAVYMERAKQAPSASRSAAGSATRNVNAPARKAPAGANIYTVRSGDSLSQVAVDHGVKVSDILGWNDLADSNSIQVGQQLVVAGTSKSGMAAATKLVNDLNTASRPAAKPASKPAVAAKPARKAQPIPASGKVTVKSGESISVIANRYGFRTSDLKKANNLNSDLIMVGQTLVFPGSGATTSAVVSRPAVATPVVTKPVVRTPIVSKPVVTVPTRTPAKPIISTTLPGKPAVTRFPANTGVNNVIKTSPKPIAVPAVVNPAAIKPAGVVGVPSDSIPYTIMEGESLKSIAASFVTTKEEILRRNPGFKSDDFKPGRKVMIPPL